MNVVRLPKFPWVTVRTGKQTVAHNFWNDVRFKTWVRIHETGELGVLDHLKPHRRYGVRPVDMVNGCFYPSQWDHWPEEFRKQWPKEYDLSEDDFSVIPERELPEKVKRV